MLQSQLRMFGVTPKLPKMELTIRTPYKTWFDQFSAFEHFYIKTIRGQQAIVNNGIPGIYLIPAGQIELVGMGEGKGKKTPSTSGVFLHTGGWVHVHE